MAAQADQIAQYQRELHRLYELVDAKDKEMIAALESQKA